jgi:hypothetical protein
MRVRDSPETAYGEPLTKHYAMSLWKGLVPPLQWERLPNMASDFLRELPGHCQKAIGTPPLLSTRRTWTRNFATTGARPTTGKQCKTMAYVLRWALLTHTIDLIICARRSTERSGASRSEVAGIASWESLQPDHIRALLARTKKEVTWRLLSCYAMWKADDSSSQQVNDRSLH